MADALVFSGKRRCRTCQRLRNAAHNSDPSLSEQTVRLVIERLREGLTLHNLAGRVGDQGKVLPCVVSQHRLRLFCKANRKIGTRILSLAEANFRRAVKEKHRMIASPAILRNGGMDAWAEVMQATESIWEGMRGDVQGDMFIAISEGRLHPKDARSRVKEFVVARNKMDKHSTFSKYGALSLDAPLYDDETGSQYDRIREDQRLWG